MCHVSDGLTFRTQPWCGGRLSLGEHKVFRRDCGAFAHLTAAALDADECNRRLRKRFVAERMQ